MNIYGSFLQIRRLTFVRTFSFRGPRMHVQLATQGWLCWIWMPIRDGIVMAPLQMQGLQVCQGAGFLNIVP